MKQNVTGLSQQYLAAIRRHLRPGNRPFPPGGTALRLGRAAVARGLETLDLARIHERALTMLKISSAKVESLRRAGLFFSEANQAIEETHRPARQSKTALHRVTRTLGRRTKELAASNRQWQRGVVRQKVRLRQLTHRVLAAQEKERYQISQELQDETAQTLLGINVRLLALKQHDGRNSKGLKNEIASAQRLVLESAKSVRRFARELDTPSASLKRSAHKLI